MRILILGNVANVGYVVTKELRKMNKDVDLAVNLSEHEMSMPEWEDANLNTDLVFTLSRNDISKNWNPPMWIRYFDLLDGVPRKKHTITKIKARINLIRMMREYDIVEAHAQHSIYPSFSGVPYVVCDGGWIRWFPYGNSIYNKLARRGYRKAKAVIITNPDTFEIVDSLPYLQQEKIHFSPPVLIQKNTDRLMPGGYVLHMPKKMIYFYFLQLGSSGA